jgi:tetratricopeptide (TPR) repeat protein
LRQPDTPVEDRIWELWVQSDSPTADVLLQQATKALSVRENKIALALLDQIVKTYPTYAEAYNKRAALHFLDGNKDKALADLDTVLDLEPRHFDAMAGRGLVLEDMGKDKEAIKALKDALIINPAMEGIKAALRALEKKSPEI